MKLVELERFKISCSALGGGAWAGELETQPPHPVPFVRGRDICDILKDLSTWSSDHGGGAAARGKLPRSLLSSVWIFSVAGQLPISEQSVFRNVVGCPAI